MDLKIDIDKLILPEDIKSKLHLLTKKELSYFLMMWGKYGVLYLKSEPGIAKSAIIRSICQKLDYQFIDIRLSMRDEIDVGLYPELSSIEVLGKDIKCLDFVPPKWAIRSNLKKTIIHFEELNRTTLQVRNAALQILLERSIGEEFKFNDHVLMVASGNLGSEGDDSDGTDVEEFDSALNNRLIHVRHTLTTEEWFSGFALENIHKSIIDFIKAYPDMMYKRGGSDTFATPRSWTMLSEFIVKSFGKDIDNKTILPILKAISFNYVGPSSIRYIQYMEDMLKLNLSDILNDWENTKYELEKYDRSKKSELIQSLKEVNLNKLSDKQLDNLKNFLNSVNDDELMSYLIYIIDKVDIISDNAKGFILNFSDKMLEYDNLLNSKKVKKSKK
jgi:hypothetical protein